MRMGAVLCGWVTGLALQLQQPQLWPVHFYVWPAVLLLCLLPGMRRFHLGWVWLGCAGLVLGFSWAGWRATQIQAQRLDAGLEGVTLRVQGRVSDMAQRTDQGWRLKVAPEKAWRADDPGQARVRLPSLLLLSWWGGPQRSEVNPGQWELHAAVPQVLPGQRWEWSVRLRLPHGHANPGGFDYELWLWEQGIAATGSVRQGRGDAPAVLLGQTQAYPVARWRQKIRDAILARGLGDPSRWGVVAALSVGDQSSIERTDWELFRTTGIAHLVSISGLHITLFAWLAIFCSAGCGDFLPHCVCAGRRRRRGW